MRLFGELYDAAPVRQHKAELPVHMWIYSIWIGVQTAGTLL